MYKIVHFYITFFVHSYIIINTRYKNPNVGLHLRKQKNKIEELELELMNKKIEIARKKGYNVKGVGQEKEFVTTFYKNIK